MLRHADKLRRGRSDLEGFDGGFEALFRPTQVVVKKRENQ